MFAFEEVLEKRKVKKWEDVEMKKIEIEKKLYNNAVSKVSGSLNMLILQKY